MSCPTRPAAADDTPRLYRAPLLVAVLGDVLVLAVGGVLVGTVPARVRRPAPDAVIGGAGRRGPAGPGHASTPTTLDTPVGVR